MGQALEARNVDAATALFLDESYWRDLVSFGWTIVTVEGHAGITDLLRATIEPTKPRNLAIEGEGTEADGITEGWSTFETDVARGRGHVRLKDGKAWTLLTTMTELKGYEERAAHDATKAPSTASSKTGGAGWSTRRRRRPRSAMRISLTWWSLSWSSTSGAQQSPNMPSTCGTSSSKAGANSRARGAGVVPVTIKHANSGWVRLPSGMVLGAYG